MRYEALPLSAITLFIGRGIAPAYTDDPGGLLVLNQKCVRRETVSFDEARRTDTTRKRVTPQKRLQMYDILVNSTGVGTLGRTAQLKEPPGPVTVDSHVTIVRPGEGVHPLYLGYAMQWRQPKIEALAEGSTGQTELSRVRLGEEIMIPLPAYDVQRRVADILYAIDTRLEILRKINENLLEQAAALYKSWAKGADGQAPEGWRQEAVGNLPITITDYVANGSFASLKANVSISDEPGHAIFIRNVDLKSGEFQKYVDLSSYLFLAKTQLQGGEILISNVGDVGSVHMCPALGKPMTLGNNMIMLDGVEDRAYNLFLYLLFKSDEGRRLLASITGGSVQMKFNKTDFRALRIWVPGEAELERFNEVVAPLFTLRGLNESETRVLRALKSTLLPKLMTGELQL